MHPVSATKKVVQMGAKTPRKKVSGPSGKNQQAGYLLREETPGQLDTWRAHAELEGLGLGAWIRRALDAAVARARKGR